MMCVDPTIHAVLVAMFAYIYPWGRREKRGAEKDRWIDTGR